VPPNPDPLPIEEGVQQSHLVVLTIQLQEHDSAGIAAHRDREAGHSYAQAGSG